MRSWLEDNSFASTSIYKRSVEAPAAQALLGFFTRNIEGIATNLRGHTLRVEGTHMRRFGENIPREPLFWSARTSISSSEARSALRLSKDEVVKVRRKIKRPFSI